MIKSLISEKGRRPDAKNVSHLPKILLFINLPQDLDMLLPLAIRLHKSNEHQVVVVVTNKAWKQSPRIGSLLTAAGIKPKIVSHKATVAGLQPSLRGVCAVITASESTASAHKGAHTLTHRANRQGLHTYTMQHGFENVGLNYFDEEFPVGAIQFASQICFIWGSIDQLPPETPKETRAKCVAVGCPKFVDGSGVAVQLPGGKWKGPLVAVFENLHWQRYRDDYRQQFLQDLIQTAIAYPQITFLVKPHHTGQWITQHYQGEMSTVDNLIVADPQLPEWEAFTAPALIKIADTVITTPSTVAMDAARAACPVAVVAYTLSLANFEPLPLLRTGADWQAMAAQADQTNAEVLAKVKRFSHERLVLGDSVGRIVSRVATDIRS